MLRNFVIEKWKQKFDHSIAFSIGTPVSISVKGQRNVQRGPKERPNFEHDYILNISLSERYKNGQDESIFCLKLVVFFFFFWPLYIEACGICLQEMASLGEEV